jgi:NADPH:quinone reductase-like Zn-dependent oxidoreductase
MKAAIMAPGAEGGTWDVCDVQRPVVTAGHVLVRVHASSLNRAEFRRLHTLRLRPGQAAPEARTGGGDAAGEVVEIGPSVTAIKPGNRVMGRCAGGFAEYALLDAREVMPAPERLSWEEAACVPIVFVVVHDALFVSGQLHAEETVLVTAAPSGVGVATLLLAKYLGAQVIGTSRSAEKLHRLKALGLDAGVVTGSEGFGAAIARVIGEKGVDMVVDNIGGDVLAPCLEALAVGGRFVTIGRMSGVTKGELDVDRLAERACTSTSSATGCAPRRSAPNQPSASPPTCCRHSATAGSGRSSTAPSRSTRSPPPAPGSRRTGMSARSWSGFRSAPLPVCLVDACAPRHDRACSGQAR